MNWTIFVAGISALGTTVQAVYTALTFHRKSATTALEPNGRLLKRPILLMGLFSILTWGAVAFDLYDRHVSAREHIVKGLLGWGAQPGTAGHYPLYFASADASELRSIASLYKMMLIVRNSTPLADRQTDKNVEKSNLYTIDGDVISMEFEGHGKIPFYAGNNMLEFYAVILPNSVRPDQISDFSDVLHLGGRPVGVAAFNAAQPQPPPSTPPAASN